MENKQSLEVLEKELLQAYSTLSGSMNFRQLRSFGRYFCYLKEFILKQAQFGDTFVDRKYLQSQLQKHYDILSSWTKPGNEDFEFRRECSKAFFEYRSIFKAMTLLKAPKYHRRRNFVMDFMAFERDLISV